MSKGYFFLENMLASLTKQICIEHCLRNGIQANKKKEGDLNLKWSIYYIQKLNSGFLYFLHPFTIYTMTHLLGSFSICFEFTFVLVRKLKNKTKTNKIVFFLAAFFHFSFFENNSFHSIYSNYGFFSSISSEMLTSPHTRIYILTFFFFPLENKNSSKE